MPAAVAAAALVAVDSTSQLNATDPTSLGRAVIVSAEQALQTTAGILEWPFTEKNTANTAAHVVQVAFRNQLSLSQESRYKIDIFP